MQEEISIFDLMYPKYKIDKPIRLIELFGGYGSQALALKYLGLEFEHWKLCEWAIKSIQAYKDIHFTNDNNNYSESFDIDEIKKFLYKKGISKNYNEPMTKEQIDKMSENYARQIFNNIFATHNLVNISTTKAKDLEIKDTDKYCYIMSYSFPCQDLSLAGKRQGMKDVSTRSGLLWEVERILTECKETGELPSILLMENVPQVHSQDNIKDFRKWILRLEELGYQNYWQDLIATDYGIPQTRNRCFMVSILGDYSYTFPNKIPLKLKLKDLLETNVKENYYLSNKQLESLENGSYISTRPSVKLAITNKGLSPTLSTMSGGNLQPLVDEKYYLSDKMKEYIFSEDNKYKVNENKLVINRDIACSKTTREGNTRADTSDYICTELPENFNIKSEAKINKICDDLITNNKVKEYDTLLTNYTSRRLQENDFVQNNNISPTLTTSASEIGVCVGTYDFGSSDKFMNGKDRFDDNANTFPTLRTTPKNAVVTLENNTTKRIGSLYDKKRQSGAIYDSDFTSPTLSTGHGYCVPMIEESNKKRLIDKGNYYQWYKKGYQEQDCRAWKDEKVVGTLCTTGKNKIASESQNNLRIRKLTPKECFRLMGVKDEDFKKVSKNQSDSSLYHLAGDSIVVDVIKAIISKLL